MRRSLTLFKIGIGLLLIILTACNNSKLLSYIHSDNYAKKYKLSIFPGAQGFGTKTVGGRGGELYIVKNLNDQGPGSLRYGLEKSNPRIIVFEVSGTIYLSRVIVIDNPFLTLLGQTSPGEGVTLTNAGISIQTHDVFIQHLAIRPGDNLKGQPPGTRDALEIFSSPGKEVYNIVVDHCSFTHAIDENLSVWGNCRDITVSNTIISKGLHKSSHPKGPHSKGILIGENNKKISIHHCILAFNDERNPRVAGNTIVEFENNLIYKCNRGFQVLDTKSNGRVEFYAANNIFFPESNSNVIIKRIASDSKVTLKNNQNQKRDAEISKKYRAYNKTNAIDNSDNQLEKLLISAGSKPKNRNFIDQQLIRDIKSQSGEIVDCTGEIVEIAFCKIISSNGNQISCLLRTGELSAFMKNEQLYVKGKMSKRYRIQKINQSKRNLKLQLDKPLTLGEEYITIIRECANFDNSFKLPTKSTKRLEIQKEDMELDVESGYINLEKAYQVK